jgi:tRNA modification GTPase
MTEADVIAAIATGSGRAAIGVIRLSGRELGRFMQALLGRVISPRQATLADFLDGHGRPLDTGIALYFPGPNSYTGEDVLELQGHGGPAVLQLLLRRCLALGARLAQPGEFSRRAFLNEKLDLTQAEAVADLIEASSEAAARAAMRSLKGEFSVQIRELVAELVALRARVEASIDFPEDDTDTSGEQAVGLALERIRNRLHELQIRAASGKLLRDGAQVVLIGPPNVGKSSLLNQLAGEDVAIVTALAGTTRDTVRTEFLLHGVPIHLVDTAGLREPENLVEQIGIDRAWKAVREADLVLWVSDVERQDDAERDSVLAEIPGSTKRIMVLNKIDLVNRQPGLAREGGEMQVEVSARTGAGIDLLRKGILEATGRLVEGEGVFLARERHLEGLERAGGHLKSATDCVSQQELFAEELRLAQLALGQIMGEFSADDLLGEIFAKFCIGK